MVKKLVLDIDEDTWREVLKYKLDAKLNLNNDSAVALIKKGLNSIAKEKLSKKK